MIASKLDITLKMLESANQMMKHNLQEITLEEALYIPAGGFRSALGILKHAAGWSHVYRSYAFDAQPRNWNQNHWPQGRRDTIIKSDEYLREIISWFDQAHQDWIENLSQVNPVQLNELRPLHWGHSAPLHEIVIMIAGHHIYHAGELNQLLSIHRREAWEEGEQVEENNISTVGYRVRPPWLETTS